MVMESNQPHGVLTGDGKWEIRFSGLDYRALFASEKIRQGETIVVLPQSTVSYPDRYSIEASPGWHIDCSNSPAGAINHSCKPNAAVKDNRIIAWTCIEPGEEINIDYKKTEQKLAEPFLCECGNCPPGTWIK